MFNRLCLSIFILLNTVSACYGLEVVAVKSSQAPAYEEALQAFRQHFTSLSLTHSTKAGQPDLTITPLTVGSEDDSEFLRLVINTQKPDLLLALGTKALQITAPINDIPIIYLLVPSPNEVVDKQDNITGVLLPETGAQFLALKNIMPTIKRVGAVYDPDKTASLVENAIKSNNDLIFILRVARSPQEVAMQLEKMKGEIDLLWMLPDSTTLSPQTEKSFYRFALQHRIPILAFSEKYLAKGASFALHLDLVEMGHLAALLALRIQNGDKPQDLTPLKTNNVTLEINHTIIDKLGIKLQASGP